MRSNVISVRQFIIFLLFLAMLVPACASQKTTVKKDSGLETLGTAKYRKTGWLWWTKEEYIPEEVPPEEYILGPEDQLFISVWGNEELSMKVTVRPDGKISMPLLSDIQAAGRTSVQLKKEITQKLSEYMAEPTVSVIVEQINSFKVYLIGKVNSPGTYTLRGNTTVLQALSLAGGFTEYADENDIVIIRKVEGKDEIIQFDFDAVAKGKKPELNIFLQPGDTIIVP